MSSGAIFQGVRVADLSQGMSGPMVGMVLADYGADVVKVEPPRGDWARALPGFVMWNRGKRSMRLDLSTEADRQTMRALAASSDVVITGFRPGHGTAVTADLDDLRAANPGLIHLSITGFHPGSSHEGLAGYEGLVAAQSGRMLGADALSGAAIRPMPGQPTYIAAPIGSFGAAMLGVQGVCAALLRRMQTGRGGRVETSLIDGMAAATMRLRLHRGSAAGHGAASRDTDVVYRGIRLSFLTVECADGRYIQMCARQDRHFANWLRALGLASLLQDPRYARGPLGFASIEDIRKLEQIIRARMATRTQQEWMDIFTGQHDVGADPFLTPAEFLDHSQVIANGLALSLADPVFGTVRQPGALARFSRTPARISRPAPQLGQHQHDVLPAQVRPEPPAERSAANENTAEQDSASGPDETLPLAGVIVLELAYFLAAPFATALLAELGARIIKIEPPDGDPFRRVGLEFAHVTSGKESIAINLKTDAGQQIMRRLVGEADALVHSFRPAVAKRLGLSYEDLHAVNPKMIYLYAGSYGSRGPQAERAAFHSTPNALCGGGILQAGQGNRPVDDSYPDPCSAMAVAAALAMALYEARGTAEGQHIETTMLGSSAYVHSNELVHYDGRPSWSIPDHEQRGLHALYRLYPCASGWIFLAALEPESWPRLARAIGRDDLLADERYADARLRRHHDAQLTAELDREFATRASVEWHDRLTVAAVASAVADEQTFEAFLEAEGLLVPRDTEPYGAYWSVAHRIRIDGCELRVGTPPRCGENTSSILAELGYSSAERARLTRDGAVVCAPTAAAVD